MNNTWRHWFEEEIGRYPTPWAYLFDSHSYLRPVIEAAKRVCPPPAVVLESGCGVGMTALLLAAHGYLVHGIDWDDQVLAYARTLPWWNPALIMRDDELLVTQDNRVMLQRGDCFDPPWRDFALALSFGVIEHYEPEQQGKLLRLLKRSAPVQIVVIPSPLQLAMYPEKVSMDERPIRFSELEGRCQEAGWQIVESFGFGSPPPGTDPGEHDPALSFCVVGKNKEMP